MTTGNDMSWETATVFISSTFNDMHAERDYLIKEVIPEVREWCLKRKIRLNDIDLRWGVTEADSESNATVDKCLRHIDKSRPFFLCFLGQRRGWVPNFNNEINDETKKRYPKITEYIDKNDTDRSVTEMEIEHSLLAPMYRMINNEEKKCPPVRHSLFFFRDDSYLSNLSDAQKDIYTNSADENPKNADNKLKQTKKDIKNRKIKEDEENKNRSKENMVHIEITDYEGIWDESKELQELSHLGKDVSMGKLTNFKCENKSLKDVLISQLEHQLELAFPDNEEVILQTELEIDLDQQNQFCYLNSDGYIKRDETEELEKYIDGNDKSTLLVAADAGYGKTMLLANLVLDLEKREDNKIKIYKRFCGTSNLSSQIYPLWKSIIDEAIKDNQTDLTEDDELYPKNVEDVRRNFREILEKLSQNQKTLIVLDAINQLPGGMNILKWLPELPENLKIIISTKKDEDNAEVIEEVLDKKTIYGIVELAKLSDESKKELIQAFLRSFLKELSNEQIDTICTFKGSDNPLYLKILLSEIRVFGSYDQLKVNLEKNEEGIIPLEEEFGKTPEEAFNRVLNRLENEEKELDDNDIVQYIFRLLSNASVGLSEDEIKCVISKEKELDEKDIQDKLRITLRQVRPFMAIKENRVDFFYDSFKIASQKRYHEHKKDDNKALSDYFLKEADPEDNHTFKGESLRDFDELPYHLSQIDTKETLQDILLSYNFICKKLKLSNIYNCISDYKYVQVNDEDIEEDSTDEALNFTQRALELSAPVLIKHKEQLAEQLWGRMNEITNPRIQKLLEELNNSTQKKWLKPTTNSLYSPKSSIIKRIQAEGKQTSYLEVTKDKKIIIGTSDGQLNIYDIDENYSEPIEKRNSPIIKIILLEDDTKMIVASSDGIIKKWEIKERNKIGEWKINEKNVEITDIYYSKTYDKIYVSSHHGIFTINLETDEIRKEDIEEKDYNQILVPRRNEAILVCDEKEVDGWDVYEMRKAYNQHHQHELTEDDIDEGDFFKNKGASGEIRFMGLVKRFLILISENGQMKMWNTLKNSGSGESIDETITVSPQDKFAQAITIEEESRVVTMSQMGVLRVYNIPEPRHPNFRFDTYNKTENEEEEETDNKKDIQTGITDTTALTYYSNGDEHLIIVGNKSNEINIIDLDKQVTETEHTKHIESVLTIKINQEEMITASDNGEYYKWNITTEENTDKQADEFRYDCISYNQSEDKLVCCGTRQEEDGRITNHQSIWQNNENNEESIEKQIMDVAQNQNGIVSMDYENLNIGDKKIKLKKEATTICAIYDTEEVFIGFEDGSLAKYVNDIRYYESDNNTSVRKIKTNNDWVIVGHEDGNLEIYTHNLNYLKTVEAHDEAITNIHIKSEDEIITVSEDKTLKIWNIKSEECTYTYYMDIYATAINMKDDKIIVGDSLGNVRFFKF